MEKCLKISGRVQGVGFRFWAVRKAAEIGGISGYISNLPDGDVLALIKGNEEDLNKMLMLFHKGPLFARVDKVSDCPELISFFPEVESGVFKRF
ncbi:MAG: acylphosphatase [Alphaproteobacteria bacterium]|nr:acylphosphatase [Alphaproteobacteria bacterium]